ncbi:MAG: SRPBCC family protein [Actinobacteria bacterium]|nr:SRPBCC family protein [Actinomycetota bacterium]
MSNGTTERKAIVTTPTERTIVVEREFDAPRERVFAAMTDPDLIPRWWGLDETETIVMELDVRPGGRWRFVERDPDGSERAAFRGVFREVVPPERVVQTFEYEGLPGHVSVEEMTLEEVGEGRTKVIGVSTFHEGAERDGMIAAGMEKGMNESYAKLDRLLAELA